jgi:hypothetical protein
LRRKREESRESWKETRYGERNHVSALAPRHLPPSTKFNSQKHTATLHLDPLTMAMSSPAANQAVSDAVAAVDRFLKPALQERDSSTSITEKISIARFDHHNTKPDENNRRQVIKEACSLLISIHKAVATSQKDVGNSQAYDSTLLGAVYNLLDFLVLEGVYPALPVGVGSPVERRAKSLLYRKPDSSYVPPKDLGVIGLVVESTLNVIASAFDIGIEPMQRHRVLNDLITANIWLAWSEGKPSQGTEFSRDLDR